MIYIKIIISHIYTYFEKGKKTYKTLLQYIMYINIYTKYIFEY